MSTPTDSTPPLTESRRRQWREVRGGLTFVWLGLLAQVVSLLIVLLAFFVQAGANAQREMRVAIPLLTNGLSALGGLSIILGRARCCSCPREVGAPSRPLCRRRYAPSAEAPDITDKTGTTTPLLGVAVVATLLSVPAVIVLAIARR